MIGNELNNKDISGREGTLKGASCQYYSTMPSGRGEEDDEASPWSAYNWSRERVSICQSRGYTEPNRGVKAVALEMERKEAERPEAESTFVTGRGCFKC